jgi:hypothetical protein
MGGPTGPLMPSGNTGAVQRRQGNERMDIMNAYLVMQQKHQEEFNAFPMAFAFSNKQFEEGMARLGLKPTDTDKIYKLGGTGGFYRREDAQKFNKMVNRHDAEMKEAIAGDTTGEGFIFDMFNYELGNHEYIITGSVDDTLDALGLTMEDVKNDIRLAHGLKKARNAQFERVV